MLAVNLKQRMFPLIFVRTSMQENSIFQCCKSVYQHFILRVLITFESVVHITAFNSLVN